MAISLEIQQLASMLSPPSLPACGSFDAQCRENAAQLVPGPAKPVVLGTRLSHGATGTVFTVRLPAGGVYAPLVTKVADASERDARAAMERLGAEAAAAQLAAAVTGHAVTISHLAGEVVEARGSSAGSGRRLLRTHLLMPFAPLGSLVEYMQGLGRAWRRVAAALALPLTIGRDLNDLLAPPGVELSAAYLGALAGHLQAAAKGLGAPFVGFASEGEAAAITLQLATALARMHAAGLAHNDLKPDNVVVRGVRVVGGGGLRMGFDAATGTATPARGLAVLAQHGPLPTSPAAPAAPDAALRWPSNRPHGLDAASPPSPLAAERAALSTMDLHPRALAERMRHGFGAAGPHLADAFCSAAGHAVEAVAAAVKRLGAGCAGAGEAFAAFPLLVPDVAIIDFDRASYTHLAPSASLAHLLDPASPPLQHLLPARHCGCTAQYAPPEVVAGRAAAAASGGDGPLVDAFAADAWALGCIAYAAVAGGLPLDHPALRSPHAAERRAAAASFDRALAAWTHPLVMSAPLPVLASLGVVDIAVAATAPGEPSDGGFVLTGGEHAQQVAALRASWAAALRQGRAEGLVSEPWPEHASAEAAALVLGGLLQPDPAYRCTPAQAVAHPWLASLLALEPAAPPAFAGAGAADAAAGGYGCRAGAGGCVRAAPDAGACCGSPMQASGAAAAVSEFGASFGGSPLTATCSGDSSGGGAACAALPSCVSTHAATSPAGAPALPSAAHFGAGASDPSPGGRFPLAPAAASAQAVPRELSGRKRRCPDAAAAGPLGAVPQGSGAALPVGSAGSCAPLKRQRVAQVAVAE
jgi:serine/threonine protein kinase